MKTIKKFLSMAALALMGAVITGCSSDDDSATNNNQQQPTNTKNVEILTTTISMDEGEQTRALTSGGVKTFAAGDQLALVYKNNSGQTVKALSTALPSGSYGSSATFTFELEDADKTKNVTYIYPASMAKADGSVNYDALNSQNGTLATLASSLDLGTYTGAWDGVSLPVGTLANQFVICAFTIKNDDGSKDLTSTVTGMTISDGSNTYTVSRSAADGPIYVAIRPTSSASISYTATAGTNKYWKSVTGKTYAAGKWYPLGLRMWPEGALPGRFRVNGVQVYFSKGNLQCTRTKSDWSTYTWSFMEPQYTTVEQKGQYVGDLYANQDIVSLFGWGTSGYNGRKPNQTARNYVDDNYYTAGNISGTNYDWGVYNTISNGGTGWRTLTNDEWIYLKNNHTNKRSTVNGVFGWVIRPYGVTTAIADTYTAAAWAAEEANGTLFLPGSTFRYENTGWQYGEVPVLGYYWTSTNAGGYYKQYAFTVSFGSTSTQLSTTTDPGAANFVHYGCNVRLVKNVQ